MSTCATYIVTPAGEVGYGTIDTTAPSGLVATAGNGQVALRWLAPSPSGDVTDYAVQYRVSPAGSWQTFTHTASTATSRTVTGLTNATTYDFRVAAIRSGVTGAYTAPVTARPVAPPVTTGTLFGINTNEFDTFAQTRAGREAWFAGRLPIVRRYNGGFVPATFPITDAVAPERRVAYSFKCDNRPGSSSGTGPFHPAALAAGAGNARFKSFVESIPAGRTVILTFFHEVNDDIQDYNKGARTGKAISHTEFKAVYAQLYPVLQEATLAPGTTVLLVANFMAYQLTVNGSGPTDPNARFHDLWVPAHGTMDGLSVDIYGNPGVNTAPVTGPGYGTSYPNPAVRSSDALRMINRLGWGTKYAILELNSPARDWDTDESARAAWHKAFIDHWLGQPTPPFAVFLWEAPSGVNWDQSYGRVGPASAVVNAVKPYILATPDGSP